MENNVYLMLIVILFFVCIVLLFKYDTYRKLAVQQTRSCFLAHVGCMALLEVIENRYGKEKRDSIVLDTSMPIALLSLYTGCEHERDRISRFLYNAKQHLEEYYVVKSVEKNMFDN